MDFTFRNEFAPTYAKRAAEKQGAAAGDGEKDKDREFKAVLDQSRWDFVPLGLESMGFSSPNCRDLAYYLIGQKAVHKGIAFAEVAALFWQSLSFRVHRQVSRNILNRYRRVHYMLEGTVD